MTEQNILKNFSKNAASYDTHANIQKLVAQELISKIKINKVNDILEIGCGTGIYTELLLEKFPSANINAIDFSIEMLNIASTKILNAKKTNKKVKFIVADGEKFNYPNPVDLISSNSCFHWFKNLEATLARYKNMLKAGGTICFSVFGPKTYQELHAVLIALHKEYVPLTAANFTNKTALEKILKTLFKNVQIEEKIILEEHPSLKSFLNKIKQTGTRGNGVQTNLFAKSNTLTKLEKIYKAMFNSIISTYQIYYCSAVK